MLTVKMFKKVTVALATTTALTTMTAMPAQAQSLEELKKQLQELAAKVEKLEKEKAKTPKVSKSEPAFGLKTDDGMFEMNIRGRIYADYVKASDKNDTMDMSGTELRTARLGVEGKAWKDVKYKFEAEFEGNEINVKDAFMTFKTSAGGVSVGQMKTPNSLDEQTSSRHIAFMERGSFTDAFSLSRQTGVMWGNGNDNYTAKLGIFKGSSESDGNGALTLAGRATYGQEMDGGVWMVGASFRNRDSDGQMRYRQRPHVHLSDRFVDTGSVGNGDDFFYGVEGAAQWGSFHVASEYAILSAKGAARDGGSAKLTGGYIDIGYFLTGEKRPLKLDKGAWDRPKVDNPLHSGGMGAVSINARYDTIDMTGYGLYGGEQDTWILGLNWYLNRHTRIVMNYSHSSIDKALNVSSADANGENSVDALGVRFQVDW